MRWKEGDDGVAKADAKPEYWLDSQAGLEKEVDKRTQQRLALGSLDMGYVTSEQVLVGHQDVKEEEELAASGEEAVSNAQALGHHGLQPQEPFPLAR